MRKKKKERKKGNTLEKGMATHSSILAWRIPWTEEAGRTEQLTFPKFVWLIYLFIFAISLCIQYQTIFFVNKYHMTLGIASC